MTVSLGMKREIRTIIYNNGRKTTFGRIAKLSDDDTPTVTGRESSDDSYKRKTTPVILSRTYIMMNLRRAALVTSETMPGQKTS